MKLFKEIAFGSIFCILVLLAIAYAPDMKGIGESENAFHWLESDGRELSIPYKLSDDRIVSIHGGTFTLINPSPQKQFLRVRSTNGEYRIRHMLQITMPIHVHFVIETVTLTDSTVTSSFEAQTI